MRFNQLRWALVVGTARNRGVNILDAFLGYGDIVIVVDERDGPLAYDILHKETRDSDHPDAVGFS